MLQKSINNAYNYIWRYEGEELGPLPVITKSRIPVLQYNLNGEFIQEYPTATEASRSTGVCISSICRCCNSDIQTAGNFIWRRKVIN